MDKRKVVFKVPIVREVAKKAHIDGEQASFIYDIFMDVIQKNLRNGNDVLLPGIGRIGLAPSKEQKSHLTGQHIPPHKRLKFKANVVLARYIRVHTREYPIIVKK
jgi:nucleoid DNA-binding protein